MSTFPTFPVYIAQYTRDLDHELPFHWELIIDVGNDASGRRPMPVGIGFHIIPSKPESGFQRRDNFTTRNPAGQAVSISDLSAQIMSSACREWMQLGLRTLYVHGYNIDKEIAMSLPNLQLEMWKVYKQWSGEDV
ncbi:hypothetical protein B0H21DRAFT_822240 [Amylocystis lapponica]|nr:hypothetical protein B0H21DRAFT_822240 [Amylocystis lapponica]